MIKRISILMALAAVLGACGSEEHEYTFLPTGERLCPVSVDEAAPEGAVEIEGQLYAPC